MNTFTKIYSSPSSALYDIQDNVSIMAGGFGLCGNPEKLITEIFKKNVQNITLISNNCGTTKHGLGILLKKMQIKKIIASYVGENSEFEYQFLTGKIKVILVPQGSLAEKIRAGGSGVPAFFTATGVNTQVEYGGIPLLYDSKKKPIELSKKKNSKLFYKKETSSIYLLENNLIADYAIVKAYKADTYGNLIFKDTTNNFSSLMCTAAKKTIVEAEYIVPEGSLDPNHIHVPGIYVDRIIHGGTYTKLIEKLTLK